MVKHLSVVVASILMVVVASVYSSALTKRVVAVELDSISSKHVINNSLLSVDIQNDTLISADIKNNTLRSIDIQDGTIRSIDIMDGSLQGIDIQDGSLTGMDIQDSSIYGVDIRNSEIKSIHVLNNSLLSADIKNNTLISADIKNETIRSIDIQDGKIRLRDFHPEVFDRFEGGILSVSATPQLFSWDDELQVLSSRVDDLEQRLKDASSTPNSNGTAHLSATAGKNVWVKRSNGQRLGILIDEDIHTLAENTLVTYFDTSTNNVRRMAMYDNRSAHSLSVVFAEPDCKGNAVYPTSDDEFYPFEAESFHVRTADGRFWYWDVSDPQTLSADTTFQSYMLSYESGECVNGMDSTVEFYKELDLDLSPVELTPVDATTQLLYYSYE